MVRARAWGVVATLTAALVAQQDAPRGRVAGFVRDLAGKRVVGADVVVLSRPLPSRADLGTADELQARTGSDGMFRAELLPGRAYSAWATWRDEAGTQHRTQVTEGFVPGPALPIDEVPPQRLRSFRITGAEAWQARAPLRATVLATSENAAEWALLLDADLRSPLPILPGSYCAFEVRGTDGAVLACRASISLTDADVPEFVLDLPPPRELRVVAVDEAGKPIAGVGVRFSFGQGYRGDISADLGRTAGDGTLRAVVPSRNTLFVSAEHNTSCSLLFEAPGTQRTIWFGELAKIDQQVKVALRAGVEARGRVLGKDGAPPAGMQLLFDCYATGADAVTTGAGVPLRPTPFDAEGRFRFCSLHTQYDFRLLALLDPPAARAAGLPLRDGIAVAPVLWLAVGRPPFQSPLDLGELRLDRLRVAQIAVKTHEGAPVPGARLAVTTADLYNSPTNYVCDRLGRLQFPLPEGEIRIGAWVTGGGVVSRLVRTPLAAGDPGIDPLELRLSATRTVRGVVVDRDGKPVAGMTVEQWDRARCADREIRELTFHCRATSEPTGAQGAFELTLPLDDAGFDLLAHGRVGEVPHWSEVTLVQPDDDNLDRLRIVVTPLPPKK